MYFAQTAGIKFTALGTARAMRSKGAGNTRGVRGGRSPPDN